MAVAMARVGRNQICVQVVSGCGGYFRVRSLASGREFRIHESMLTIITQQERKEAEMPRHNHQTATQTDETNHAAIAATPAVQTETAPVAQPETPPEPQSEPVAPQSEPQTEPAPPTETPRRKTTMLDVAYLVLDAVGVPMNTREILAEAERRGWWTPGETRTPEQSLYSAMFMDIRNRADSRFRRSAAKKGKFELNR